MRFSNLFEKKSCYLVLKNIPLTSVIVNTIAKLFLFPWFLLLRTQWTNTRGFAMDVLVFCSIPVTLGRQKMKKNSKISHQHISFEYDDKTNDNHQLKVLPADVF